MVVAVLLAAANGSGLPARAESASSCTAPPTYGTAVRSVGGRRYLVHVPASAVGRPVPLVVSLHGAFNSPSMQEAISGWSAMADRHGFVVAYPEGRLGMWDYASGSVDIRFVRGVVADVAAQWCIDGARVYAEGYSNGGYLAQRLACDAAGRFAAIVAYGSGPATQGGSPCRPSRPIAVGLFHGSADWVVAPGLGRDARNDWAARNGCTAWSAERVGDGAIERSTGCQAGVEVLWRTYDGQGHGWPTRGRAADQRSRMWAFLAAHPIAPST